MNTTFYNNCKAGTYNSKAVEMFGIIIPTNTNEIAQGFRRDQVAPTAKAYSLNLGL